MSETQISEAPATPLWLRRISSLLLIIFCFELGLFLIIYPWTVYWTHNYFSGILREIWANGYLRGAVSGLGLLNVWIAIAEVFRMFSRAE